MEHIAAEIGKTVRYALGSISRTVCLIALITVVTAGLYLLYRM